MSELTVSAGYVRSFLQLAEARGAETAALLEACGVSPALLESPDARIPFDRFKALMRHAKTVCNEPALALYFGAAAPFNEVSIVGLIAYSAGSMGAAFEQTNRYARLVVEVDGHETASRFAIVRRSDGVWLEDRRRNPNDFPELTESTWARFVWDRARAFPDRPPYVLEIHVTHPAPPHAATYRDFFAVPVRFGSDWNAMRIEESWLDEPTHGANRYVFGIYNAHADALLAQLLESKSVRGQIEAALIPVLHTGEVSMTQVARRMGFSRSTLHRRLKAEGEAFEIILDDLRRRMALDYLDGRKVSVNETAYLTGFSDPSAFSRAFRRWTGTSPGRYRSREG
ncbi:MAG: AraC family transcriptional regulator [Acidobacteria bacterium]|nr:AraC family transcriptional regulator [Acidobacteriota bacterium]